MMKMEQLSQKNFLLMSIGPNHEQKEHIQHITHKLHARSQILNTRSSQNPHERRGDQTGLKWAWAGRPKPAGPAHFWRRFGPPFLAPEGSSTLKPWRHRHSQGGEPFSPGGHPQSREREKGDLRREINHLEGSTHKWRRRKTPSEG
jgi:hypothetical protein